MFFICANDANHTNTVAATVTSEVTTPATCETTGVRTYTANVTSSESLDNTAHKATTDRVIDATGHSWAGPYYKWTAGSAEITKRTICSNNESEVKDAGVHTTTNKCERKDGGWTDTTAYIISGDLPELYNAKTTKQKFGDINMHFTNQIKDASGKQLGGKGMMYDATVDFDFVRPATENAKNNVFVKIDNSFYYGTTAGSYGGTSYVIFYSDLSVVLDSDSKGFNQYAGSIKAYDSENHNNSTQFAEDSDFVAAFLAFTRDCRIVIRTRLDVKTHIVTVTYTYYSNVSGYEFLYQGYTQTFQAQYSDEDFNNRDVNSVRICRNITNSTMDLNSIEYYYSIDRDIVSSTYRELYARTIGFWPQYDNVRDPIVNITGDENNYIW